MAFEIADYIPPVLLSEIKDYLRSRGNSAHIDYEDSAADEDSATGALGSKLYRELTTAESAGGRWRWGIRSKKFVGKGRYAQEPVIGADAIVEFMLENEVGATITKGLLFQAKKEGSQQRLAAQVVLMEELSARSSAVVDYSRDGYRALAGSAYLDGRLTGDLKKAHRNGERLGDFLADEFVGCNVGVPGLSYDANGRKLQIPSDRLGELTIPARVLERIRIETTGPIRLP